MIRLSAHLSTLFPDVPELERPTAARSLGFTTVETWWPPADDRDAWVAAVSAASVRAVLVNADGGDLAAGERGFCTVAERHDEVVASVRDAMELARARAAARRSTSWPGGSTRPSPRRPSGPRRSTRCAPPPTRPCGWEGGW